MQVLNRRLPAFTIAAVLTTAAAGCGGSPASSAAVAAPPGQQRRRHRGFPDHGDGRQRSGAHQQAARLDCLALADRHRDALCHRRRPSGQRRRPGLRLPAAGTQDQAVVPEPERRGDRGGKAGPGGHLERDPGAWPSASPGSPSRCLNCPRRPASAASTPNSTSLAAPPETSPGRT